MKRDKYNSGGHHFWVHFIFGIIFGAGLGAWISWGFFDSRLAFIAVTAGIALVVGFCCGRWGDPAWEWIVDRLWWLW